MKYTLASGEDELSYIGIPSASEATSLGISEKGMLVILVFFN